jgi:hypothetical protein
MRPLGPGTTVLLGSPGSVFLKRSIRALLPMRPDVVRPSPANPARPPKLYDYPSHHLRVIPPPRIAANRRLDFVDFSVTFPGDH